MAEEKPITSLREALSADIDAIAKLQQFTQTYHRDVYPAIDARNQSLSAAGKTVMITGGGAGIGKGIALVWAAAGATTIIITGRDETSLQETAEEIKKVSSGTKVLAIPCDVTDQKAVENLFSKIKPEVERLDVLICNVGGMKHPGAGLKIGDMEAEDWWSDIELNFKGTFLPAHQYINAYNATGTVISISSGAAGVTFPGESSYSIAKMANTRFIEYLHVEYESIRAFSLAPGIVLTRAMPAPLKAFAIDTMELVGGNTLYLSTDKAEHLRGGWMNSHWDVEEMEAHAKEIKEKGLLRTKFLNANLGALGHQFET